MSYLMIVEEVVDVSVSHYTEGYSNSLLAAGLITFATGLLNTLKLSDMFCV